MLCLMSGICLHEKARDGGHLNVVARRWGKVGHLIKGDFESTGEFEEAWGKQLIQPHQSRYYKERQVDRKKRKAIRW